MDRVGCDFKDIESTINDIITEFGTYKLNSIREALRNGSLGMYGQTFRLSTQEICIWIRKYSYDKNSRLGI